jgi:hypothetical protein
LAAFYAMRNDLRTGDKYPDWKGDLLVGLLYTFRIAKKLKEIKLLAGQK